MAPEVIEKSEEPHCIIPHQVDEILKEQQMKYPKLVETLDRILCLIEKQKILSRGTGQRKFHGDCLASQLLLYIKIMMADCTIKNSISVTQPDSCVSVSK